jgi:LAO/AO transport system kinase
VKNMEKIIEGILAGKSRYIARTISMVENNDTGKNDLLAEIFPHTGKAMIIGITGSPGAGKSSLTDVLTKVIRQGGAKVGIIAVDPSSPFTGGALLGDRIRMQDHALDPGVFIRSMATRGRLGGLSRATKDAVKVLDAAGFDVIIVETVGVGQSELDVMTVADTILVVLNPAGGDYIQVIKAGIMELADIFVVNKADLPGADKTAAEVEAMLDLSSFTNGWRPPVVATVSIQNKGIDHLWAVVEKHHQYQKEKGLDREGQQTRLEQEVLEIVEFELVERINRLAKEDEEAKKILNQVLAKELDPYSGALKIINLGI